MDVFEFVCVMTAILAAAVLIFVKVSTASAIKLQEMAEKQRLSAIRSKAASARYEPSGGEPAPWVAELLGQFGVSPEVLFADEMPAELVKFMPMIKGFVQSGGLKKLLGGAGAPGPEDSDHAAI